jgi:hypothetical protein
MGRLGKGPLKNRFPTLYFLALDPTVSVARAYMSGVWHIPLHQALGQRDLAEWVALTRELGAPSLPLRSRI